MRKEKNWSDLKRYATIQDKSVIFHPIFYVSLNYPGEPGPR